MPKVSRTRSGVAVAYSPCAKCPFRKDVPIYLNIERRQQIVEDVTDGAPFWCHQSVEFYEDEDGYDEPDTTDSVECAGAVKALLQSGGSSQMSRISQRLGMADLDKTETSPVEVWRLDDWNRLAMEATGDKPVWEIGDEDGVRTCVYVGPNCTAPAGYLTASGAAVHGLEEAEYECEGCGEPVCEGCIRSDGCCGFCSEVEGDEEDY